jgi:MFS family permease
VSQSRDAVPTRRWSSFGADLRAVLAERDFRKLFGARLVGQAGDGIITAAVGTYVFFNASSFPNPMAGAIAFLVLYVPYSVLGPFAGVLIDRWSRRQILVWSGPIRALVVVVTAALMAWDVRSVPLYLGVLVLNGVSRFVQASLSVALPHVTPASKLVVANAVSDTVGGLMSAIGGLAAAGINVATGDTERGAAVTMLVGGACYVASGLVATIMPRDLLGPALQARQGTGRLRDDLAQTASGLAEGARYVLRRRGPRAALGAAAAYSFLFGPLFLMTILVFRNYFYPGHVTVAEGHIATIGLLSAVGYFCAALLTPPATRRLSKEAWIALMLLAAGVTAATIGESFNQDAYLAIGFLLYLTRQGVAISAVTILQSDVSDGFRGRVFAFYDAAYNAPYAIGCVLFALFMPVYGRSALVVTVIAAGFAVAALVYWLSARPSSPSPSPEEPVSPASAAQRSSS